MASGTRDTHFLGTTWSSYTSVSPLDLFEVSHPPRARFWHLSKTLIRKKKRKRGKCGCVLRSGEWWCIVVTIYRFPSRINKVYSVAFYLFVKIKPRCVMCLYFYMKYAADVATQYRFLPTMTEMIRCITHVSSNVNRHHAINIPCRNTSINMQQTTQVHVKRHIRNLG